MSDSFLQSMLNDLANRGTAGTIKNASFGWATILRYQPLIDSVKKDGINVRSWEDDGNCYVFEIGRNCGDVFSVNMVESIEMTKNGAIIKLK